MDYLTLDSTMARDAYTQAVVGLYTGRQHRPRRHNLGLQSGDIPCQHALFISGDEPLVELSTTHTAARPYNYLRKPR